MKPWATAFLVRSLRQESRFVSHHLLRAAIAAFVLLMFLSRVATASMGVGVGGSFARTVMYCCYTFVTLLGGIYFSAAIVEEKEEQTLPLLRLTGASPLAILLGKSVPRLGSVFLLLLVMTPFLMLAITLGGVLLRGLLTALLGILTYSIMFSQMGLYASVISQNFQKALSRTLMLWLLLEFLPFWGWVGSSVTIYLSSHGTTSNAEQFVNTTSFFSSAWLEFLLGWLHVKMNWLSAVTEEFPLYRNLPLYLADFGSDPVWRPQMTAHLITAALFLLFSRLLFEPMTAKVVAEGFQAPGRFTRLTREPRRVHGDALVWKSWRWLSGGWPWFFVRVLGIPLSVWGIAAVVAWRIGETLHPWFLSGIFMTAGMVVFIGHFTILPDRLFNVEVQQKTLSSLLLLPLHRNSLIARMLLGLVPAIAASLSCVVCGLVVWFAVEPQATTAAEKVVTSAWFYEVFLLLATTLYFGLFLSVRVRHAGMLLAIVLLWFIGPFIVAGILGVFSFVVSQGSLNYAMERTVPILLMVVQLPFCVWMHKLLIRGIDAAGAQE